MSEVYQFYFQYCKNGHMLYSPNGPIKQSHCQTCGQSFLFNCESCGTEIPNTFRSIVFFTSRKPVNFPSRPKHCTSCGEAYPWASVTKTLNDSNDFWGNIHPSVANAARKRYESGHFADAVEAALKALNVTVKTIYQEKTGEELDGVTLMRKAFSPNRPVIILDNQDTQSGRDIQQGYMDLFAGAMAGIRNPKAHDIIEIDEGRAIHHLFLTSLLFYKLDERPAS